MPPLSQPPPLSLYIHIPWCVRKCPYCDFNSHALKTQTSKTGLSTPLPEKEYLNALAADLQQDLQQVRGRTIESIFIGGGTPSLFSPEAIDQLLTTLHDLLPFSNNTEITLEANPGTVEQGKFAEFHAAGINRLSIGIQSFSNEMLQALGRIHDRRQAIHAAEQAHAAGFDNINLDLMFALPEQTTDMALADLRIAMDLEPTHLSWYQLTIEPNTLFHHSPPSLPGEETQWKIQQQGQELLGQRGYGQYEISAYAQAGQQCRHNLNYWRFGDYLGIGAGAHGKITHAKEPQVLRSWKQRQPQEYMENAHSDQRLAGISRLDLKDLKAEFMMNALRLTQGFQDLLFETHTGLSYSELQKEIQIAQQKGLLDCSNGLIQPTPLGMRFLNDLIGLFIA
jgi:oxygen-independent coproporphyrinogen-3 oxidase